MITIKKCDWGKRKNILKSLTDFIVPIKSTTTTEGKKFKKKNPKESTEQVKK